MPRLLLSLTMLAAAVWLLLRRGPGRAIVIPSDNGHDAETAFMAAFDEWRLG